MLLKIEVANIWCPNQQQTVRSGILDKLTVSQSFKKFPAHSGTQPLKCLSATVTAQQPPAPSLPVLLVTALAALQTAALLGFEPMC